MYSRSNNDLAGMGATAVLLVLLGIVLVFLLLYFVAKEFDRIAAMKGHNDRRYFWWTFLFGIVGMLMVIALPDLRKESRQTDVQPTPGPVRQPGPRVKSQQELDYAILKSGGWKCVCGKINGRVSGFCTACGRSRQAGDRRFQHM